MTHTHDDQRIGLFWRGAMVEANNDDEAVRYQNALFISRAASGCCDRLHEPLRTLLPWDLQRRQFAPRRRLHQEEMKQTEALLAGEMSKLSIEEMSKAQDDVHCIGQTIIETPELIHRALVEFGEEARAQSNTVYKVALQQNRKYVEGEAFRLKFLRCNLFEIKSSVSQMMKFLQYKAKYFGIDKLGSDIMLSDLTNEDRDLLQSGFFHVQQCKDRSGRNVVWFFNGFLGMWKKDVMIRAHYFLNFNILTSDPELQKRGNVLVYYDTAQPGNNAMHRLKMSEQIEILDFTASVPCRYSGFHVCLKTGKDTLALNNAVVACATRIIPRYTRVRTRLHYGSDMELQYKLQDHGISLKTCPVDENGVVLQDVAKIWYEKSVLNGVFNGYSSASDKGSDSSSDNGSSMTKVAPSDCFLGVRRNDVLLGRGTVVQFRPGNICFRNFLNEHYDAYDTASRVTKGRIVAELSQTLKSKGVRFLKAGKDKKWVECDDREVEETIARRFRSARKEKRRK
eukprot:scaffold3074_cov108-Cylindrotheca_fusiformis.AAC.1